METSEVYENLDNTRVGEGVAKLLSGEGYSLGGPSKIPGKESIIFQVNRTDNPSENLILKLANLNEVSAYRNVLDEVEQESLVRMEIPKLVETGVDNQLGPWLIMQYKNGKNFNDRWHEREPEVAGGGAIDIQTTDMVLDLVEDLGKIDCNDSSLIEMDAKLEMERFDKLKVQAVSKGLISQEEIEKAEEKIISFLDKDNGRTLNISNGDFQFRNFLEEDNGKVTLIDWEKARVSRHEIEHCVMNQWMLMWNNEAWQEKFLKGAVERFDLNTRDLEAMLLLRSLSQAVIVWKNQPDVRDIQLDYFRKALEDGYLDGFLEREPNVEYNSSS